MSCRLLLLALSLFGFSGCGMINTYLAGSDNSLPPAELISIDTPIAIQELWNVRVGSGTEETYIQLRPAVEAGRIYAASHDGIVMALDADTGASIWQVDTDFTITAGVGLSLDLVLVGTSDGVVLALDQGDGKEVWRVQVTSEVLAAPQAAEGVVVVRTGDGKFIGLDSRTGTRLWVYTYTMPVLTLRGTAPPLLAQGAVIAGLDNGKLLVLSLDKGTPMWERIIAPPQGRTELERMVDIDAEPRLIGSVLYVAAYQGNVTAIDLRNGNILWTRDFSSHAGMDVDSQRVYLVDDSDAVWALDWRTGATLWKQSELTGRKLSAPAVVDDYVVVGDFEGYLHWLRRENGKVVGRVREDKKGVVAMPVVRGGTLFVLGEGGRLGAFRAGS